MEDEQVTKIKMEFVGTREEWQALGEYLKPARRSTLARFKEQLTQGLIENYALPADMDPPLS